MMKRKAAGRPQAGRFRRISRGGTSSVVEAYTGLSHSFKPKRDLLQFRNKKPLTSVTFGGNI